MSLINTKIVLKKRPNPSVTEDLFEKITDDIRDLVADEFLVEVIYLSIDPAMRGWISSVGNYSEPVPLNDPMRSFGVGKIISSKNNEFLENEFVVGWLGWQKYSIVTSKSIQMKIPSNEVPLSANLGVLGLNGITAYAGLVDKCCPKEDDTVITFIEKEKSFQTILEYQEELREMESLTKYIIDGCNYLNSFINIPTINSI